MIKQYLTFTLDNTIYALDVYQVQEVLPYTPPQKLPCPDPVIEGLIHARDQSISVVNLRRKFGLADKDADKETRIIVLELHDDEQGTVSYIGAVTDSVNEVLDLDEQEKEPPPETGHSIAKQFISGIAEENGRFIIILDAAKIFSAAELEEILKAPDKKNTAAQPETPAEDVPAVKPTVHTGRRKKQ